MKTERMSARPDRQSPISLGGFHAVDRLGVGRGRAASGNGTAVIPRRRLAS
jgi:hypothetical protein